MQIMTLVNHNVALDFKRSSIFSRFDGMKQIPCIVYMLTKELYFLCILLIMVQWDTNTFKSYKQ